MTILDLKREAMRRGLCDEYIEMWNSVKTMKDLMDMALTSQGAEFITDGVGFNWGLSPDFFLNNCGAYINGNYLKRNKGYTAEMYAAYDGKIIVRSTLVIIIGCKATISIGKYQACEIFAAKSALTIKNEGECCLHTFGNEKSNIYTAYGEGRYRFRKEECSKWGVK